MYENDSSEINNCDKPVELTEMFVSPEKKCTLSDIITVQSIICVAISISFIVLNMLYPSVADSMHTVFESSISNNCEENFFEEIAQIIKDMANAKPLQYD